MFVSDTWHLFVWPYSPITYVYQAINCDQTVGRNEHRKIPDQLTSQLIISDTGQLSLTSSNLGVREGVKKLFLGASIMDGTASRKQSLVSGWEWWGRAVG